MDPDNRATVAVILAGGLARRMQVPDKSACLIDGKPILTHILERIGPQVGALALNANGPRPAAAGTGMALLPDTVPDRPGPLAGILAALDWAHRDHPGAWVLTTPCDTPFLPLDLVACLHHARNAAGSTLSMASSGGRAHPTVALWPTSVREDLRWALTVGGIRKVRLFTARHACAIVEWETKDRDPFLNVNTPDDLHRAARISAHSVRYRS